MAENIFIENARTGLGESLFITTSMCVCSMDNVKNESVLFSSLDTVLSVKMIKGIML